MPMVYVMRGVTCWESAEHGFKDPEAGYVGWRGLARLGNLRMPLHERNLIVPILLIGNGYEDAELGGVMKV